MATKTATGNGQTLKALVATDTTYSSGGFSGVILDFSDPSVNPPGHLTANINSLTLTLVDPALAALSSANSVFFGSTSVALTLDRITAVKGSADDDQIGYTFNAPTSGTAYTVYASEGNDVYDLYGNSTLTYAAHGAALLVNVGFGSVTGKTGGATDTLGTAPNHLVLTSFDDTVLLNQTITIGLVDGGANTAAGDYLSWAVFGLSDVTVDLDNGVDSVGNGFTNFEVYRGSAGDNLFATSLLTTTGYTLLSSEGNDIYQLNGLGTVSYADYASVGLLFNLKFGSVTGKSGGATDTLTDAVGKLIGTAQNDTYLVDATNVVVSLNGGAGIDLLKFSAITGGATVDLDAHTASGITTTYSNIENFIGSGGGDHFTAVSATGFTIFASGGSDIYSLNGHGTLSYAGTTSPLNFNLSAGVVIGKSGGTDAINGAVPIIIGSDGNDNFTAKSTGNATLDGGAGDDVLRMSGARADYLFNNNHDGSGFLSKLGQTISFSHIESVVFTDGANVLTTPPADDLFGVGRSATLWRSATGEVWVWNNNGTGSDSYTNNAGSVDPIWGVVGIGDLGGDGKADVVFHNSTNGEVYLWNMNGGSIASQGDVTSSGLPVFLDPSVWHGLGVRDFDGDGFSDVLWQQTAAGPNPGQVYEWSMSGNSIISQGVVGTGPADSSVLGFGDVNGDGRSDVVWYNEAAGAIEFWFMNGSSHTVKSVSLSPSLHVDGVGDFNGDGIADLIGHDGSGNVAIGTMGKNSAGVGTGSVVSLDFVGNVDMAVWTISQTNDYNGDGYADVLFTGIDGNVWVWEMNGSTITAQGSAGTYDVAQNWTLYV